MLQMQGFSLHGGLRLCLGSDLSLAIWVTESDPALAAGMNCGANNLRNLGN